MGHWLRGLVGFTVVVLIVGLVFSPQSSRAQDSDDIDPTISALQTQVAEDEEQISELETQVAKKDETISELRADLAQTKRPSPTATPETATSKPSATPKPSPTPTSAPSSAGTKYPPVIAELIASDSKTSCDHIGWSQERDNVGTNLEHYGVCSGGAAYLLTSIGIDHPVGLFKPKAGRTWIICAVVVANLGTGDEYVSPLDFSLVDASNTRYQVDYTPLVALGSEEGLASGVVPGKQNVNGVVTFDIPTEAAMPLRVEIRPSHNVSGGGDETLTVILDPLLDVSDF